MDRDPLGKEGLIGGFQLPEDRFIEIRCPGNGIDLLKIIPKQGCPYLICPRFDVPQDSGELLLG